MKKYWIIIILLIGLIVFQYFYNKPSEPIVSDPTEYIERIDSLELEIDSLYKVKEETYIRIDTVYQKLDNNTKEYEKNFNTIVTNNASEDLSFFLNYIGANKARLDNLRNNSGY